MFLPCAAKDDGDLGRGDDDQEAIAHLDSGMIARDRPVLLKRKYSGAWDGSICG